MSYYVLIYYGCFGLFFVLLDLVHLYLCRIFLFAVACLENLFYLWFLLLQIFLIFHLDFLFLMVIGECYLGFV